jgi:gliding motility-associated-like protein
MMRKIYIFFILLMLTINPNAYSSHIYGGELLYQHISGNTYRIVLYLYGDCGTPSTGLLAELNTSTPQIQVYDEETNAQEAMIYLPIDAANSNVEVTPVCPAEANQTMCVNASGTLPGIKRYIYQDTITLSHTSTNWRFTFTGVLGIVVSGPNTTYKQAGRTESITNLIFNNLSTQIMYLVARLNNDAGPNSSPVYNTVPTPFYCINVQQQYNQGATDPNGDSLAFNMASALTDGAPVLYQSPYTPLLPMSTSNFVFDNINGQMLFTPNLIQKSLIVNEVREYKNGVLVGSSMREMTFIILNNCQNQAPEGDINTTGTSLTGGINQGNNVINVCAGTSQVSFDLAPVDPNPGDSITLTPYNIPVGSNLIITNNNTPTPTVDFTWNLAGVANGIYTFYINYKDNGCPLNTNQTLAYTIQIANPYDISASVIEPTRCFHKAAVQINATGGVLPRTITVSDGSGIIKTYLDTTGTIIDSFAAGTYMFNVSSDYFTCSDSTSITVIDEGQYPVTPIVGDITICSGEDAIPPNAISTPGATLHWYNTEGNEFTGPPTYNSNTATTYTWFVNQQVGSCVSEKVPVHVVINSNPEVLISNTPGKVCYADQVYIDATGAQSYLLLPADKFSTDETGKQYVRVIEPITLTVIGTDSSSCKDTATIIYSEIEQCCNFAYPNAFTPNSDGKNEKFRPVMYGNMEEYELNIYNRFGERIYQGKDQRTGWDGKYKGQLCDVGMYFFKVKAKCYTGQKEENNGVVYLLR